VPVVNLHVKLGPNRKRMAKSMIRLMDIIAASDQKEYARGKAFVPIFPTTDSPLQGALTTVQAALVTALGLV
jgi:hypothetical protein